MFIESQQTFRSIVEGNMSFVAELIDSGAVVGFGLAHLTPQGHVPCLHDLVEPTTVALASTTVTHDIFVHDVSVLPRHRGRGIASALAGRILAAASSVGASTSLVAVNASQGFWSRHGFVPSAGEVTDGLLRSYGPCMVMRRAPQLVTPELLRFAQHGSLTDFDRLLSNKCGQSFSIDSEHFDDTDD
jgi:GNAT superfamily N-acetyltransferase